MFLGLRTIIYPAPDLDAMKAWYTELLGIEPYFDEPFYVGFSVNGYELALDPNSDPGDGPTTYWGVADIEAALSALHSSGGNPHSPTRDVGDNIRVASVTDPTGNVLAIIENPHFQLANPSGAPEGAGR